MSLFDSLQVQYKIIRIIHFELNFAVSFLQYFLSVFIVRIVFVISVFNFQSPAHPGSVKAFLRYTVSSVHSLNFTAGKCGSFGCVLLFRCVFALAPRQFYQECSDKETGPPAGPKISVHFCRTLAAVSLCSNGNLQYCPRWPHYL